MATGKRKAPRKGAAKKAAAKAAPKAPAGGGESRPSPPPLGHHIQPTGDRRSRFRRKD